MFEEVIRRIVREEIRSAFESVKNTASDRADGDYASSSVEQIFESVLWCSTPLRNPFEEE